MKKIKLVLIIFVHFYISPAWSQNYYKKLNGFQIDQSRKSIENQLGKPYKKGKFEDGYEYEVFLFKPAKVYMTFEYAADRLKNVWSIQITGGNPNKDIGFNGIKLGVPKEEVIKVFGEPIEIVNIGEYCERWEYAPNFSFEILNDRISSVKIRMD